MKTENKQIIKVRHGIFVENPKCKICGVELTHEWLDGDYTLLICDKPDCSNKAFEKNEYMLRNNLK